MKNREFNILLRTNDPENLLDGRPLPAVTTLLHKVCDGDQKKFEEACRLIELFVNEAFRETAKEYS